MHGWSILKDLLTKRQHFLFQWNDTSICDKCIVPFQEQKNIGLRISFNEAVQNIKGPVNVEDFFYFNWIIQQIVTNIFCSFEELENGKEVGTSLLRCRAFLSETACIHPFTISCFAKSPIFAKRVFLLDNLVVFHTTISSPSTTKN